MLHEFAYIFLIGSICRTSDWYLLIHTRKKLLTWVPVSAQLLQQDLMCITLCIVTVKCIVLPCLLLFSLPRMKPWWDPCSSLRMWCRTSDDDDRENERARCECVCVAAYVQYIRSLLFLFSFLSSCGLNANRIPHSGLLEGIRLECFEPSRWVLLHNTEQLTWQTRTSTQRSQIGQFKIKMLSQYKAARDQWRAMCPTNWTFFFFLPKDVLFMPKYNCMCLQNLSLNICYGILAMRTYLYLSQAYSGWKIWDISNVMCSYFAFFVFAVIQWQVLLCWPGCCLRAESVICLSLVCLYLRELNTTVYGFYVMAVCLSVFLSMLELSKEKEMCSFSSIFTCCSASCGQIDVLS